MLGNIVRLASGPIGLAVTVAELILAASKVVDALKEDAEEEA